MVTIYSAQIIGLTARVIPIEVDVSPGLHVFSIVGLADKEVQESRERISAAVRHIDGRAPHKQSGKIIVSLAPADIKKEGPHFDLPIALGYLSASGQASFSSAHKMFIGEIGLNGMLRPVRGVLSIARSAAAAGFKEIYVPHGNGKEAALVDDIAVYEFEHLQPLLEHLEGAHVRAQLPYEKFNAQIASPAVDFAEIHSQRFAKRALEIAAAGGHNVLLWGPPGSGKTMLAKAFSGILPPLDFKEALEITSIYSVAGLLSANTSLIAERPIRAPHHTASPAAIIGGGTNAMPGEITLAHRGVLFLDEFPEFQRPVLEALREPLEEKIITIARVRGKCSYPANVILLAAMNPCPCGNKNHPKKECICRETDILKYQRKISGPILDRIDLHAETPFMDFSEFKNANGNNIETSAVIRDRTGTARLIQQKRFADKNILVNAEMGTRELKQFCKITETAENILSRAVNRFALSARACGKILKIARTIADLENKPSIADEHIGEALQYRPHFET